jgi:hypothetical protein
VASQMRTFQKQEQLKQIEMENLSNQQTNEGDKSS